MLDILYRDEHLIAIHKPAGLLVHRSEIDRHETRFAIQLLRDQIGQKVWPVHRLDRGTSGVLLFAFHRETLTTASQAFERNEVDKTYMAVVRGWPAESGVIDHALTRQYDDYERRPFKQSPLPQPLSPLAGEGSEVSRSATAGKVEAQAAITRFERLVTVELPIAVDRYPTSRYALLRLHPETGRRHQIRRHLKHIAHPIIGDSTHGKGIHNRMFAEHFGCQRMLLACMSMRLSHPVTRADLLLETRLDADFAALIKALGWNT